MNYKEHIEKAINFIDIVDFTEDEGVYDPDSGCNIICVRHRKSSNSSDGYMEQLFLIAVVETKQVSFHYRGCSFAFDEEGAECDQDDWGFTFSSLCEVGDFFQPFYRDWLDKKGLVLESGRSESYPYCFDLIRSST